MKLEAFFTVNRSVGYPVRDIMTANPICWDGSEETRSEIVHESRLHDLTYIPIKSSGKINSIVTRENLERGLDPTQLTVDWLIAANTPILELVSLFLQRPDQVFLILESSTVTGLVAPADLNKIPARASFYLLVAHFEAELAELVRAIMGTDDTVYQKYLTPGRYTKISERKSQDIRHDIQMDITYYFEIFDFEEIIMKEPKLYGLLGFPFSEAAAKSKRKLEQEIHDRLSVGQVRNPVSHATNVLITSRKELQRIDEICGNLIFFHEKIQQARHNMGLPRLDTTDATANE